MTSWLLLVAVLALTPILVRRVLAFRARRARLDYGRSRDPVLRTLAGNHRSDLTDLERARLVTALDRGRRSSPMRRPG